MMDENHKQKWTYLMGLTYMIVNIADFVAFPIMYTIVQFWETQAANDAFRQWVPLTLTNGGFIHIAFAAILGISAFNKEEKKPNAA
jgi:heme/copper-type cytochrome/quinol oxidase subunit 2